MNIKSYFSQLIPSWIQSLKFFLPNNFIPFFLITVKSWLESYKKIYIFAPVLLLIWVPILFAFLFNWELNLFNLEFGSPITIFFNVFVKAFVLNLFLVSLVCILRPSVNIKNFTYFKDCLTRKDVVLAMLLLSFVISMLYAYYGILFNIKVFPYLTNVFIIFYYYFLLDSRNNFKNVFTSFGRSLLMIIYNYPFYLISYWTFYLISYWALILIMRVLNWILGYFSSNNYHVFILKIFVFVFLKSFVLVGLVFVPFYLAWFGNFYFKRVHDQFGLYFNEPKN